MKKLLILLLLLATAILALAACTSDAPPPTSVIPPPSDGDGTILPHPAIAAYPAAPLISPGVSSSTAVTAAQGANDFAFRLAAILAEDIGDENLVVSPYSVWMPLAALVNATREPYRAQLIEAIGAAGLDASEINQAASRMLFSLTNEQSRQWAERHNEPYHNPLRIANALFIDYNFTLRRDFAQTFMDYFRGEIMTADFAAPATLDSINQWAYDQTEGLIPSILEELCRSAFAVILNAIYFQDGWSLPFDPDMTHKDIFHGPTGESEVYFMEFTEGIVSYFEDERLQAVQLNFANGGGMAILLPKEGCAAELLGTMSADYFAHIIEESRISEGRLVLPRFTIEHTIDDLKYPLEAMGVPIFDELAAPLTNGLVEEAVPVWVSDAIQKAMIEINEEGATAAAVTAMAIVRIGGFVSPTTFEMICNRPFVFVLYRHTTDGGAQVLFTGVVNQP